MSANFFETFISDVKENFKGKEIKDFINPEDLKKNISDEMKKEADTELEAIENDKTMNSIEKSFKKAYIKLKNSILGGIFGRNEETDKSTETTTSVIESYEDVTQDADLLALASGPDINYTTSDKFQMYLLNVEEEYDLPYKTLSCLMQQESGGKLYKNGEIITSSAKAKGLFQFIPETADVYIKELGFQGSRDEFYKNPIISAKACALYLQKSLQKGADLGTILAHYNAGPGVLDGKNITADNFDKLPKETQKYVLSIGSNILQKMGINSNISAKEIEKPQKIKKAVLQSFLETLNKTPLTKNAIKHQEAVENNTEILANNMDEVSGFGSSLLEGLKGSGLQNSSDFRGENSEQLLKRLDDASIVSNIQKGKSCILLEGYNDITNKSNFKENMQKIIDKIKPTQVILCTLYYNTYANTPKSEVDRINTDIRNLATTNKLPLIDIQKDNIVGSTDIANDGLHLTSDGYKKVYNHIQQKIEKITA